MFKATDESSRRSVDLAGEQRRLQLQFQLQQQQQQQEEMERAQREREEAEERERERAAIRQEIQEQIDILNERKVKAAENEEYTKAAEIKKQITELQNELQQYL